MSPAEVEFDHRSVALTVAELRAVLDRAPDDAPVLVLAPDDSRETLLTQLNASAAESRDHPVLGPQVMITASAVSGRYRRPAEGELRVTFSDSVGASESATGKLVEALSSVAAEVGHRGESEIDASEPGLVRVTWQAANVSLAVVLERAVKAVREIDPSAAVELKDESN